MIEVDKINGLWIQGQEINYGEEDELYYQDHPNVLLKQTFHLNTFNNAIFRIGCLGYYIVHINGKRVGNFELNNDWTNFAERVYYEVYDVTEYLRLGENEIVIELGNGMYNPSPLRLFGKYNLRERLKEVGTPKVICDLWVDKSLVLASDENWKYSTGNLLFNNLYLGETIDFRRNDNELRSVITHENDRNLVLSFIPKIKKFNIVKPKKIEYFEDGIFIDFNEMISGFINITVNGKRNQEIVLQYSENFANNKFDFTTSFVGSVGEEFKDMNVYGGKGSPKYAIQTDKIICEEGINCFENKFTYHSFRYIYIRGCTLDEIQDISAIYVHTDLKSISNISTDNQYFNSLFEAATRTKLNNVHNTFEDCARERLGYGGDMVALATSNLYMFDLEDFYKKILLDFRFDQTENGGLPETAPYMGIQSNGTGDGEGPILWQFVYPYLMFKRYQYYGDKSFIEEEYPYLEKHVNYIMNYNLEELAHKCLGDHGSVLIAGQFRKPTPDKLLLGYCTVLLILKYNILLGNIIGKDVNKYQSKYNEIKDITIKKFKNEDGSFGEGTQSGYAFAIMLALDDPIMLCKKFVDKIKEDQYIFNSGIFGMAWTYEILNQYGYDEIIEKWLLQESDIGFKKMLSSGSKVLSELFIGEHQSMNHAMFASYQQWYYQGLAGIKICEDAEAFNKIVLSPYFSKNVNLVNCEIKTKNGKIHSSWSRKNNKIEWIISIPQNIHYEIRLNEEYKKLSLNNQLMISIKER